MSLYESWIKKAFNQEGHSVDAIWADYLPREQKIYEYIIGEKVEKIEGKVSELAERFDMTDEMIVAFIDGLNASLETEFDMESLTADSDVCININFEKLFKLMVEYKAEHLYSLPQWDGIYDAETKKRLTLEQKNARTVVKAKKSAVTIPALAVPAKNTKNAAAQMRKE